MNKGENTSQRKYSNDIAPNAFIESSVRIGMNNTIGNNVVITGDVLIGNNNYIGAGAVIGGGSRQRLRPETWDPGCESPGRVIIGNDNLIFEYVTIHRSVNYATIIENQVSIGAHTHIAHDSIVRSSATLSVNISLGGHTIICRGCNIGLGVRIHPRSTIGAYSMCGMGAVVKGYVIPGSIVRGIPAKCFGVNRLGLKRYGYSDIEISEFDKILTGGNSDLSTVNILIREFEADCKKWKKSGLSLKILTLE